MHMIYLSDRNTYSEMFQVKMENKILPIVEQELFTLPERLSSHPVFSGVHVAQYLVFCLVFCRSLFVRLAFFFWP